MWVLLVWLVLWGYCQPIDDLALRQAIEVPTLWTYALAHGGPDHLISNLVGLSLATQWFERRWGSLALLFFCLGAAPLTALAEVLWTPDAHGIIGCSGVLCALIGTCMAHSRAAAGGVLCMAVLTLWKAFFGDPGYAHMAHLSGFCLGFVWVILTNHETSPVRAPEPTAIRNSLAPGNAQPTPRSALRG